jgi:hypothetical protein
MSCGFIKASHPCSHYGLALAAFISVIAPSLPVYALDSRLAAGLMKLDPVTRLEQRCDAEAMERVAKSGDGYRPDRVVAYAFAEPQINGNQIEAKGGAFRSKEEWYRFSYICTTGADHMSVTSFEFKIGDKIPKEKWEDYGLWG